MKERQVDLKATSENKNKQKNSFLFHLMTKKSEEWNDMKNVKLTVKLRK